MNGDKTGRIIFIIFALLGYGLILGGVFWIINSIKIGNEGIKTTAVITEIDTYRDSDGDRHHTTYVTYEVDGRVYDDVDLGYYSSGMYEGEEIEIKYLEDKPGNPYSSSGLYFGGIILMIMGLIFAAVGTIPLGHSIKASNNKKNLLKNGRCLSAKVESIELNMNYSVNGRHPYIIICTYEDPFSGIIYRFKSDNIWRDPSINTPIDSEIGVYVDPADYSKHYVDTEKDFGYGPQVIDYT